MHFAMCAGSGTGSPAFDLYIDAIVMGISGEFTMSFFSL